MTISATRLRISEMQRLHHQAMEDFQRQQAEGLADFLQAIIDILEIPPHRGPVAKGTVWFKGWTRDDVLRAVRSAHENYGP